MLREREDFTFYTFPKIPSDLDGYVRLGLGGPVVSDADATSGLLILDGTWSNIGPMELAFASVPVRTLPAVVTAYPRTSKLTVDPDGGLATIEAIYAAYRILGRSTDGLLDHYHWAAEFVATLKL